MASMNVAMTLTLLDQASPAVKAFMGQLERLEGVVNSVGAKLSSLASGLGAVGAQSAAVQGGLDAGARAAAAMEGAVNALASGVATATTRIGAMATEAGAAAASMLNLGRASTEANIGGMFAGGVAGAQGMTREVNTLGDSIKGMAALWAAFKIERGLKASVEEASDFQQTEARIKALNQPEAENKAQIDSAVRTSRELKFVSVTDALEARIAAITGTANTSVEDIDKTINDALKAAIIFKMRGDKSDTKDIVRNLYGLAEMRGITSDPEAMKQSFDFAQRVGAAAGGKLSIKDMETVSRQVKYGGGAMVDEEGWAQIFAFANQLKSSGAGGGGGQGVSQAGTATTQLIKWAEVGPKNKETVRLMTAMGLMDASKVRENESDTTMVNVAAGAMTSSQQAIRQPLQWARDVLGPAMLKLTLDNIKAYYGGKDPNDPKAQEEALAKLAIQLTAGQGGVNVGNAIAQSVLPGPSARLTAEATLTRNAKKTPDALADLDQTYKMQMEKFTASLDNLKLVIGTQLLPILTPLIEKIAEFVGWIAKFSTDHPIFGFLLTAFSAFGALSAAIFGVSKLFGPLAGLLGGTGAAAGGMGAAIAAAGEFIAVAALFITRSLLKFIPLVGLILLAWDAGLGEWISKLNVFGHTVGDWASTISDGVVTAFKNMWLRTREFFGFVSKESADAEFAANSKSFKDRTEKRGIGVGAGASGDWERPGASGDWEESAQAKAKRELEEKAKLLTTKPIADPKPRVRGGGAGRASRFNEGANEAANEYKLEEDALRNNLKVIDALYKAGSVSVANYYIGKQAALEVAVEAEIATLEKERAALLAAKQVDRAAVNRVGTKIDERKDYLATQTDENRIKEQTEINALKQRELGIDTLILEAEGKKREVKIANALKKLQEDREAFVLNDNPGAVAKVDSAISITKLEGEYERTADKIKTIQQNTRAAEADISYAVKAGIRTQAEGEDEIYALRQREAQQMLELLAIYKQFMDASTAPDEVKAEIIGKLSKTASEAKGAIAELTPLMQKLKGVADNAFTGFFDNILKGGKSAKAIFKELFASIMSDLNRIIAKMASDFLTKSLTGAIGSASGGGGGGSAGGWLGDAAKSIGGWFGSGGSSTYAFGSAAGAGATGAFDMGIGGSFASGIDRVPNDMLAMIHKDETVLNVNDAKQYRGGDSNQRPISVTNNFITPPGTPMQTQSQMAAQAGMGIQRAIRRNG